MRHLLDAVRVEDKVGEERKVLRKRVDLGKVVATEVQVLNSENATERIKRLHSVTVHLELRKTVTLLHAI